MQLALLIVYIWLLIIIEIAKWKGKKPEQNDFCLTRIWYILKNMEHFVCQMPPRPPPPPTPNGSESITL